MASPTGPTGPTPVEFFFDPGCPFTWRTSRWLTTVAAAGAATVTWRLMSLAVLNEGREIPEQFREGMRQGTRVLRALAAAQEHGGSDAVARLYTVLGTRRHEGGASYDDASVAAAVAEAGLPESVAAAVDDEGRDAAVRAEHEASQTAVGDAAGSPVTALLGRGFFGPVVVPPPTGDEALALFEAVRLAAGVPGFSELKTARNPF
jgi:2-hydroxychromene-2-carboxylate isomerase